MSSSPILTKDEGHAIENSREPVASSKYSRILSTDPHKQVESVGSQTGQVRYTINKERKVQNIVREVNGFRTFWKTTPHFF